MKPHRRRTVMAMLLIATLMLVFNLLNPRICYVS
jgi:hypothetical protein